MFSGIRWRLVSYYLLVLAVVVLVMGAFFLWFLNYFYLDMLRAHLTSQAGFAVTLVKEAIRRGDSEIELNALCRELGDELGIRLTLIEPDGRVIGDSAEDPAQMDNHRDRPEIEAALEKGQGSASRFSATLGEDMLYVAVSFAAVPDPDQEARIQASFLRLAMPLSQINSAVFKLRLFILGALIVSTGAALFVGIALSEKITRPLKIMARAAHAIAGGNFEPDLIVAGRDEMADLACTIREMGRSLQVKVEQILLEKNKLDAAISSMDSGVILVDRHLNIELLNPAAERIFQIYRREIIGTPVQTALRNYVLYDKLQSVCRDGSPGVFELKLYYPDLIILQTSLVPVIGVNDEVVGVLALFHDITRIRSLEKMRSDFVANVSHELRTPLTAVRGYAETILHEEMDRDQLREFLQIIEREAQRLARLVDSLLDLSRIEDKKSLIAKKPVDLVNLVQEALQALKDARLQKEVSLETHFSTETVLVSGNYDWLRQAVVNILDNSIKYGFQGGSIRVRLTLDEGNATLEIEDDGPGIPAEDLPYIFERFYRVDKARSRQGGGTGLGLAIVKHILEAHDASYGIRSDSGRGAVFYFTLPAIPN